LSPALTLANRRVVLFDGVCTLCNAWVRFIIKNDPKCHLTLCSVQSEQGQIILKHFGYPLDDFDTLLLVEDNQCLERSDAVLAVCRHLAKPWRLLSGFSLLPLFLRDGIYRLVARHRYRIFGQQEHCLTPSPDIAKHFLQQTPSSDTQP